MTTYATNEQADAQWAEIQNSEADLLDLAKRWVADKTDASIIGVFNLDPESTFKWQSSFVKNVETRLTSITEVKTTTLQSWSVDIMKGKVVQTNYDFKQDEAGARAFSNTSFEKLSHKTDYFTKNIGRLNNRNGDGVVLKLVDA